MSILWAGLYFMRNLSQISIIMHYATDLQLGLSYNLDFHCNASDFLFESLEASESLNMHLAS